MKKLFLIVLIFVAAGCGQEDDGLKDIEEEVLPVELTTKVYLQQGAAKEEVGGTQFIFKAEGRDFEVESYEQLLEGKAYDKVTEQEYEADIERLTGYLNRKVELLPGEYFVALILINHNDDDKRYSYTTITVKPEEDYLLEKTFAETGEQFSFEEW